MNWAVTILTTFAADIFILYLDFSARDKAEYEKLHA